MNIKKIALPVLGVLALSVVGLLSNAVTNSASASSDLYTKVEEHYEIAGHNQGTDWQMVHSLDELEDEQIVTLAAIDPDLDADPVTVVFDCWSMDHDYISILQDGSISDNKLHSDSASYLMFDRENEDHGRLSTLENGVNELIGMYKDDFDFWQMTPTYDHSNWRFDFDETTHEVKIWQILDSTEYYLIYLNGCEMFFVTDNLWNVSNCHMYLFKDNFVHSGTRKLSDVKRDGSSLIYDFSVALLDTFDGVCEADGSTNPQALAAAVLSIYQSDESDALRGFSKKVFKYAIANESGDTVQKAAALYDYIMMKYTQYSSYEWFERSEFYPTSSNQTSTLAKNTGIIIAASIIGATLLGFGAIYLSKKRKNEER